MRRKASLFTMLIFCLCLALTAIAQDQPPRTVAESSGYKATSRYQDVMSFIHAMQQRSSLLRVETMGYSPEGHAIPLVILGDPPPASPAALRRDNRMVVYIQANIHAGEVEGKEASLMLIRDLLEQPRPPYLDRLVILIAPIFNIDGNELISPDNRRNQLGPEQGVGVRHNGQTLDLNRDSMKLESPELRALVQNVLIRWDPALLVDCHTTNGSYHEEPVTWSWPLNPNGDPAILAYMRDTMMPALQAHLKDKYDTLSIPYGNFMGRDMSSWRTFGHQPRYVTNYVGLRNRLAILIENYAHASYKDRVMGNYNYLLSILDYCRKNRDSIAEKIRKADENAVRRGLSPTEENIFAVEVDIKPLKNPVTILGWEMEVEPREGGYPRMTKTDRKKTYTLPYFADFVAKRTVRLPFAYLLPVTSPSITEKLLQHGLVVERLEQPVELEVESFQVDEIKAAARLYQGHRTNTVKGKTALTTRTFPAGCILVRTAQPLGSLASYLLEPESDDGLLVWNFFDRYLVPQWRREPQILPVYKLYAPVFLATEALGPAAADLR